jgi:hypothetical protein
MTSEEFDGAGRPHVFAVRRAVSGSNCMRPIASALERASAR